MADSFYKEILLLLKQRKVRFLIIGGHAVAFHGYLRYTADLDILIEATTENYERLLIAIKDAGFDTGLLETRKVSNPVPIKLVEPPLRIEILTKEYGESFDKLYQGRQKGTLEGVEVSYIGYDDLLKEKAQVMREKDIFDIKMLEMKRKKK